MSFVDLLSGIWTEEVPCEGLSTPCCRLLEVFAASVAFAYPDFRPVAPSSITDWATKVCAFSSKASWPEASCSLPVPAPSYTETVLPWTIL